jgi:hypothetical protein
MDFKTLRERIMMAMHQAQELPSPGHLPEQVELLKQQLDTIEQQARTLVTQVEHMERIIVRERLDEFGMHRDTQ